MKKEYKKYSIISIAIFFLILGSIYILNNKNKEYEFTISETVEDKDVDLDIDLENDSRNNIESILTESVPVYICGQVNRPDVYYLDQGTIIKDAIDAAGGFTDEADKEVWNLAMEIQKGEKIYIPKIGEEIDKNTNSYDNRVGRNESHNIDHELININIASNQELTALPGIGPTIAQNIIDYREANGKFETLQDITNVSRIGQATLEKIKDYICFQ